MAMVYYCSGCGKEYQLQLPETWIMVCSSCQNGEQKEKIKTTHRLMPNDWTWLKIGSAGVFDNKKFHITGRVRIQTQHDVMNMWCALSEDKAIWINHTMDSMRVYAAANTIYVDVRSNPVGEMIRISDKYSLRCESKGECTALHIEGEVARLPIENDKFEVLKASNAIGNSALIFQTSNDAAPFLWGAIVDPDIMKFKNTIAWDEWK